MNQRAARKTGRGFALAREHFAPISAVEGIMLTAEMRETFKRFDLEGLSAADRRCAIVSRFAPAR